jgi:hypothetical protein
MDVTGFLCVSLRISTVKVGDEHVHRLVSVLKMVTMLEGILPKMGCSSMYKDFYIGVHGSQYTP